MIIIKDWVAQVPEEERQLAYVGENETVVRELLLTDAGYEAYIFYMDMAFDLSTVTAHQTHQEEKSDDVTTEVLAESGSTVTAQKSKESRTVTQTTVDCQSPTDIAPLEKRVAADGVHLLWTVLAQHTRLPGLLRATVRAVGPDGQVKKTSILHLTVGAAVAATPAVPVEKSEFEQMEQQLAGRMETFRADITALSDEAAASAQAAALRAAEAAQDAQSAAAGAATATEKAASAAASATAAAASETKAAGSADTAAKKAAAATVSATEATQMRNATEAAAMSAAASATAAAGSADQAAAAEETARQQAVAAAASAAEAKSAADSVSVLTYANALRGKKRGGTVRIDDAAPVQHELALQVKSKNLIPYPYRNSTKTINGITFTVNEDGTITANGTATKNTYLVLQKNIPLQLNTAYTLSGTPAGGSSSTYCLYMINSGVTDWAAGNIYNQSTKVTFTPIKSSGQEGYGVSLVVYSGTVCDDVVFSPQIEEGDTATAYAKAVAPAAVTVRRNGKNLIPYPYWNGTKTINDVTFTVGDDGTVTANGTATANIYFVLQRFIPLQLNTTYTLSGAPAGSSSSTYYLYAANQDVSDWAAGNILNQTSAATFTPIKSPGQYGFGVSLVIRSGTMCNNVVFRPQIEVGDAATAYEPYIPPTEYTPAADGTVAGVLTLNPTITLTTDSAGAVLEAEYSRDVNKAFAALQAAVEALQS